VNSDVLVAHQVLARRNAARDLDVVVRRSYTRQTSPPLIPLTQELTQPRQLRAKLWLFSVNAEPHRARGVPGVDILALRHLREVGLEGARVVCVGVDVDFYAGTRGDAEGGFSRTKLVAADGAAGYIADEAVVLPVLGGD
jgi:hypothetical protein